MSWFYAKTKELRKKEKGVTIVALVVTIIVMLILAGIVISSVKDGGVTKKTKEAVGEYNEYKATEQKKTENLIVGLDNKDKGRAKLTVVKSTEEWTKENIKAETNINYVPDGYEIYMKKGETGSWIQTTETIVEVADYSEPVKVYASLIKDGDTSKPYNQVYVIVDNIDNEKPDKTKPDARATKDTVTVTNRQKDEKSGIDESKTEYAIRKKGEDDWSDWQKENEFKDLEENTDYEVKTKSTDKVGNEEESEITEIRTKSDYTPPTDTAPGAEATTSTIEVINKQVDRDSGIDEGETKYAIRKVGEDEWSDWQTDNEFRGLDENTEYEVKTKSTDKAGNEQESKPTKIKTEKLESGTLTLKKDDENGEEYTEGESTNHNVYVKLNNGNAETRYESLPGSAQTVNSTTGVVTINTEGTTTLRVTTTDGKNTVTKDYVIVIDKTAPKAIIYGGATVVKENLLRWYDATNNQGNGYKESPTEWVDLSGHQNGTLKNVTFNENGYASFNGSNSAVNIGRIDGLTNVTLDVEVKVNAIQSGEKDIICNYNSAGLGLSLYDGKPRLSAYIGGYKHVMLDDPIIVDKQYHITGTYDGSTMKLYVNGVLCGSLAVNGTIKDANIPMAIGANPSSDTSYDVGFYSNVKVYSAKI